MNPFYLGFGRVYCGLYLAIDLMCQNWYILMNQSSYSLLDTCFFLSYYNPLFLVSPFCAANLLLVPILQIYPSVKAPIKGD